MRNEQRIKDEQLFINLLLNYKDLVGDWQESTIKTIHFDNDHRLLLSAIQESYNTNSLLTRDTFTRFIKQRIQNDAKRNAYIFLYDKVSILDAQRDNFRVLLEKILDAYVLENAVTFVDEFRKNITSNGPVRAVAELSKKIGDLAVDASVEKSSTSYESVSDYGPVFYDILCAKIEDKEERRLVTCGIREIDDTMVVGFAPGTLTLFCSDVGGGKTTIMINVANNIFDKGYNVLFVPLEMPRDKMFQKFLSLRTHVPFEKIERSKTLTQNEVARLKKEIDNLKEPKKNSFYIMETYERVPVSVIRKEIEHHISIFKPDVVVVDYIANLVPDPRSKETRSDLQIGEMLKDLRVMGRAGALHESGFAIVSAAQIGREGLKRMRKTGLNKTSFYSEDLRGSQELPADSDNVYALMPDESQPENRTLFFVIKARYGKKVFGNGETRASLEVHPEICLIKSVHDEWQSKQSDDIMKKVDDVTVMVSDNLDFDKDHEIAPDISSNESDAAFDSVNVDDIDVGEIED